MKKKKNKIWIILFLALAVVIGGAGGFGYYQREVKAGEREGELVPGENQRLEDGIITSVIGNEIELENGEVIQVPVGTEVETRLGAITTFSRLSPKDQIQMLVEEDGQNKIILKIWITG